MVVALSSETVYGNCEVDHVQAIHPNVLHEDAHQVRLQGSPGLLTRILPSHVGVVEVHE